MGRSAINKVNLGVPAFIANFVNGDLAAGILTINHNLGIQYNSVIIYDNNGKIIIPDDVTATSVNVTTVDLSSYGTISGTWRAVILDSGATMNSIASGLSISGQADGDRLVFNGTAWVRKQACLFAAYMAGDTVIAASGVIQDAAFNAEQYDIGGNFNTGSYTFTAPVSGYYAFNIDLMWKFLATNCSDIELHLVTTGQTYYTLQYGINVFAPTGPVTRWNQSLNVIAYMAASDTAKVRISYTGTLDSGSGVAAIDDGTGLNSTRFMGYLIA